MKKVTGRVRQVSDILSLTQACPEVNGKQVLKNDFTALI
jgi:hypothetical protein